VNQLLAPTIATITLKFPQIDLWKILNWLFVSYYWTFLNDVGQISTTTYPAVREWDRANFSQPLQHYATNNIFVNDTLFEIYSAYMTDTILPILDLPIPEFSAFSPQNRLQTVNATFVRSYSCVERRLKPTVSWIFSVMAVDYSLIGAAYTLSMYIAAKFQKRMHDGKHNNSVLIFKMIFVMTAGERTRRCYTFYFILTRATVKVIKNETHSARTLLGTDSLTILYDNDGG
jgi:hypothetical protein